MISPNANEVRRWFRDNGDNTHILNHDLSENSIVMDLGAYTGVWADQIISKFKSNIYLLEPIDELHKNLNKKYENNDKVKCLGAGISIENQKKTIYLNKDASSTNIKIGTPEEITCYKFSKILKIFKLDSVDLLQMNIEGDEYDILDEMIKSGSINKVRILQVQFHNGIENDIERRDNIQEKLKQLGFVKKYDYPFVWEAWEKQK